jgi:TRAP-type C4-dicarboxylate transport system permease small subunit
MSNLSPETRAHRLEIYVSLVAFVVGFFVMLATFGWLITHFVEPGTRWWEILHLSISAIFVSVVFGGLGFAVASVLVLSRYHYKRGVYRCDYCGRPLKGAGIRCDCRDTQGMTK